MTKKVYAPNVHLFAIHLRNTLKAGSNNVEKDAELLWQKCDALFEKLAIKDKQGNRRLNISGYSPNPNYDKNKPDEKPYIYDFTKETPGSYVELSDDKIIKFEGKVDLPNYPAIPITGIVNPQRIYDAYALTFNIRRPEKDEQGEKTQPVDIAIFGKFNPQECLLTDFVKSTLGQTLLLTAWLTDEQKQKDEEFLQNLANDCLEYFIPTPEKRPKFRRKGKLFGSYIFEYGKLVYDADSLSQATPYQHVLIWLFSGDETSKKFDSCYWELQELFYYRNKIISAFQTSLTDYKKIYQKYEKIENNVQEINQVLSNLPTKGNLSERNLHQLKEKLKNMPQLALEYARLLRNLQHEENTIEINTKNYEESLEDIRNKLKPNLAAPNTNLSLLENLAGSLNINLSLLENLAASPNTNLSFLESFSKEDCPYFQERIKSELAYFVHGSELVDKTIDSIRGIVEIEQAKRDQRLQDTIAVIGVAIGAGGIFAGSYALYDKQPLAPTWESFTSHPVTKSVSYSLLFGTVLGLLTFFLIWLFRRRSR